MSKVTGQDVVNRALQDRGKDYVFGAFVPKDHKNWPGPFDCAEAASYWNYQAAGILYGCNQDKTPATADAWTGYWYRDAAQLGRFIPVEQAIATPGAALLRTNVHIVISLGNGRTIEAACAKLGVCELSARGRRWDRGIIIPGIDYQIGTVPGPIVKPGKIYRLTFPYMIGPEVKLIQQALGIEADGVFGPATAKAVKAFQIKRGDLIADGECGPLTRKALGMDF